ncbi:MAG TPA: BMP family ABC transporter substrate-binding protein [Thermoanaerobaculia bacterium]|nr:BMP family ABC transporter substrate-binding protein [Thermoanaerobaculia bacterium]
MQAKIPGLAAPAAVALNRAAQAPTQALVLALALAMALAAGALACRAPGVSPAGPGGHGKVHVGIVFDLGGKDDRSFNAAAWAGCRRAARELPIVLRAAEPGDPASIEPALRAFAERGYDLIIGVGFAQAPVLEEVARDYPRLDFAVIDGVAARPNVASLVFKEQEGSYLVGMIAARVSKTGVLGFVGGMDIPLIHRFAVGYEEGARAASPRVRVLTNYAGITEAAWNDPGRGKELAAAQIGQGADVVFAAAGNTGLGVFDAAEQYGVYVIGCDSNQNWIKPGRVLTSMVKRVDNAVYQVVANRVAGRFHGGIYAYGLANGGIGYALDAYNRGLIPAALLRDVEAARRRIVSGEIRVTDAMAPKGR